MTALEFLNILIVAIALAMDSFTVSISGGASLKKVTPKMFYGWQVILASFSFL